MYCEEGKPEWRALDAYNNVIELPLAIQLNRFTIDEYPPKLMVVSMKTGLPQPQKKPQTLVIDDSYTPTEFIDMKALMGDASDNYPGVTKVGPKTASRLIQKYHTVENLYEHVDEMKKSKLKENCYRRPSRTLMNRLIRSAIGR